MNIAEFKGCKSYATRENALKKLHDTAHIIPEHATVMVAVASEGRFVPVVFLRGVEMRNAFHIASAGVVVVG
jgi:hypothetical protein